VAGQPLRLGTLETTRDFTFVGDTAQGFLMVGRNDGALGEVVNVGSGREVSIRQVVEAIGAIVGRELIPESDEQRMRPEKSEVSRLLSDSSKAYRIAGWRASTTLDDGLRQTVDWIREHIDLYRPQEYAV